MSALPLNTVPSKITVSFRLSAWMSLSANSSVPVRYATIPRSVPAVVPAVQATRVLVDERVSFGDQSVILGSLNAGPIDRFDPL